MFCQYQAVNYLKNFNNNVFYSSFKMPVIELSVHLLNAMAQCPVRGYFLYCGINCCRFAIKNKVRIKF